MTFREFSETSRRSILRQVRVRLRAFAELTDSVGGAYADMPRIRTLDTYFNNLATTMWTPVSQAVRSPPPLSQLAASCLARNLPTATSDQSDDAESGSIADEELWYNAVPETCRRAVAFAHVIELFKAFAVNIPLILVNIARTCMAIGADQQAFDVIVHFLCSRGRLESNQWDWAFSTAAHLNKVESLIHAVGQTRSYASVSLARYFDPPASYEVGRIHNGRLCPRRLSTLSLAEDLTERHADLAKIYAIRWEIEKGSRDMRGAEFCGRVRQLLCHSCLRCPAPHACLCVNTLLLVSNDINGGDREKLPFWFLVMLRGSQLRHIHYGNASEKQNLHCHDFIVNQDPSLDALAETIAFWPTFEALSGLKLHLRAIGAHAVARKLTILTLNNYDRVCSNTHEKGGQIIMLEDLQEEIATNTEFRSPAGDKWRHEPLLQAWVPSTPAILQPPELSSLPGTPCTPSRRYTRPSLKRFRTCDDIDDLASSNAHETDERDLPHKKARQITQTGVGTVWNIRFTTALPFTAEDDELTLSRSRSVDSRGSGSDLKKRKYADNDQAEHPHRSNKEPRRDSTRDRNDRTERTKRHHRSDRDHRESTSSHRRERSKERTSTRHSKDDRDRLRDRDRSDRDRERRVERDEDPQLDQTVRKEGRERESSRPRATEMMDLDETRHGQPSNGPMHSTGRTESVKTADPIKKADVSAPKLADKPSSAVNDQEEKIRLRRERVEQWRRERLAKESKEAAEKGQSPGAASLTPQTANSPTNKVDVYKPNSQPGTPVASVATATPPSTQSTRVSSITAPSFKTSAKVATKMSFGKSNKIGLSIKPAVFPTRVTLKPNAALALDDDEEGLKLSKLPTRKLKTLEDHEMLEMHDTPDATAEDVGEDSLDAFMMDVSTEVQRLNNEDMQMQVDKSVATDGAENEDDDDDGNTSDNPDDLIAAAAKKIAAKRKDLAPVDHSKMEYEDFRKDFYIEPPELASMTPEEVDEKRLDLDGIKVRGRDCPKPIEKWTQFGLPVGVGDVIRKVLKYERPSPIQAQAMPAVMSGRDVIGIAKTGSGKTIAFLLPMFRHIKDQRPLEAQEGPVALIMTPTRELAVQIHKECKHFARALNLRAVCCYGGSPIKDQIAELKKGAEIIICTPGRMIDLLCANSGRVTNLRRVTYLVLDEADRMFDMGFEPQVMRIVNNVRPSRQTILFSATFPKKMEALARKILRRPLEITVGARSVVASDVTQIVEVVDDDQAKFLRLLEILGRTFNEDDSAKLLIFTDRQEAADNLLTQLLRKGYPCQSLHGGKDQSDRDSTINDFKTGTTNVLIATSVAARGLDVKQLKVVINYECPNHMEDYVHRVGRTGRAGNKGTAYTFITPDQDKFAVDIIKALTMSEVPIPEDLQKLGDSFVEKVKQGAAQFSSSGFGGKGLEILEKQRDVVKRIQQKAHGGQYEEEEESGGEEDVKFEAKSVPANAAPPKDVAGSSGVAAGAQHPAASAAVRAAQEAAAKVNAAVGSTGAARARDIIAEINAKFLGGGSAKESAPAEDKKQASDAAFAYEIEINDYPQKARWRVTNKEQISQITEMSGAAITTRGTFFGPGKQPGPGERKLYLFIEGDTQLVIDKAKVEIKRIITEATIAAMESEAQGGARYSVL
ncbi:pre-mRNA processing RNA-helicase [Geranomyces variabilis]|nr:pre-mRNA processing RNA-helicase [Geranomyces variabilis]